MKFILVIIILILFSVVAYAEPVKGKKTEPFLLPVGVQTALINFKCHKNPHFLSPLSNDDAKAFMVWRKTNQPDEAKSDESLNGSVRGVYRLDFDNSGRKGIVLVREEGSGHYIGLYFYKVTVNGYKPFKVTRDEDSTLDQGSWFVDKLANKGTVFASTCGKNSIVFGNKRWGYTIKNKNISKSCDPEWLAYDLNVFAKLYAQKEYRDADESLKSSLSFCSDSISEGFKNHYRNNLAATSFFRGEYARCLRILNEVTKSKKFEESPEVFKQSVAHNKLLCQLASKKAYDYSWMFQMKIPGKQNIEFHKEYDMLLSQVLPDVDNLKEEIRTDLFMGEKQQFTNDRYFETSGHPPHGNGSPALLWVDILGKYGVVAIPDKNGLLIISKKVELENLPKEFWKSLENWIQRNEIKATSIRRMNHLGKINSMDGTKK